MLIFEIRNNLVEEENKYDVSILLEDLRNEQTPIRTSSMKRLKDIGIHIIFI